jgi:prolipoprotein diacylglyceryltransferase
VIVLASWDSFGSWPTGVGASTSSMYRWTASACRMITQACRQLVSNLNKQVIIWCSKVVSLTLLVIQGLLLLHRPPQRRQLGVR